MVHGGNHDFDAIANFPPAHKLMGLSKYELLGLWDGALAIASNEIYQAREQAGVAFVAGCIIGIFVGSLQNL